MTIRPARRGNSKPLIGLHSESGAGKTYSALVLARGFVGPEGKICMIETESGRGEAYADPTEYPEIGGYDVISLTGDFSPEAYAAAISEIEVGKYDAMVIDSASHEWEGVNGVLDQAAKNQESGAKGMLVWQKPKISHKREFVLRFTQTPIPLVILCMRSRYPMLDTGRSGSDKWVRSQHLDPIQSDDILYEMFVHGWIKKPDPTNPQPDDHAFVMMRCTSRDLEAVFPKGQKISAETGKMLRAWCEQTGRPTETAPTPQPKAQSAPTTEGVNVEQLKINAERAASRGTAELEAFWKRVGAKNQKLLAPIKDDLKAQAAKVDAP